MLLENFYIEVLQKLEVLAVEDPISASDRLVVKEKYEQVHAELSPRDFITWFDDDDVPDEVVDAMATIIADRLKGKYSTSPEKKAELRVEADDALTTLIAFGQRRKPPQVNPNYY